ncbi:hypothetical protein [Gracilibacillus sp. Marseille-QA3620]
MPLKMEYAAAIFLCRFPPTCIFYRKAAENGADGIVEARREQDKGKKKPYTTLVRNPKMLKKNKEALKWLKSIRGRLG